MGFTRKSQNPRPSIETSPALTGGALGGEGSMTILATDTPNIALPCLDAEGLRYGPVTACSEVYDSGHSLYRDDSADGPSPGGWTLRDGQVVLGHKPDGEVTAQATLK